MFKDIYWNGIAKIKYSRANRTAQRIVGKHTDAPAVAAARCSGSIVDDRAFTIKLGATHLGIHHWRHEAGLLGLEADTGKDITIVNRAMIIIMNSYDHGIMGS